MSPTRLAPSRSLRALGLSLLAATAFPAAAGAQEEEVEPGGGADEVVAEALFLADTLPAGSHDFNLVLAVERHGREGVVTSPTLQYAAPLGDRMGFTVDVTIPKEGGTIESPGASLKLLLREAAPDATGLSASADVYGSLDRAVDSEVGLALGALRPLGRVALRATALAATGVSTFTPHLHAGASAAVALSPRWRALGEVVAEVSRGGTVWQAGPTLKVALRENFSLTAGALFEVGRSAMPAFTVQLTSSM